MKHQGVSPFLHGGNIHAHSGDVIDFSASINPLGPPEAVRRLLADAPDWLPVYPDPDYRALRSALAEYCGVDLETVIVGNGATQLMFSLFRALPAGRVLLPLPLYSEYERAAVLAGHTVQHLVLDWRKDFAFSAEAFQTAATDGKADCAVICQPNNPTGLCFSQPDMKALLAFARDCRMTLIVDETFAEFLPDEPERSFIGRLRPGDPVIVLRAQTKFFGMPGLRLGYAVCMNQSIVNALNQAAEPWSVNGFAAVAGPAAVRDQAFITRSREWLKAERPAFEAELAGIPGIRVFPGQANYLLLRLAGESMTAAQLRHRLLEQGLMIRDAADFKGLDAYFFRVAVKSARDNALLAQQLRTTLTGG